MGPTPSARQASRRWRDKARWIGALVLRLSLILAPAPLVASSPGPTPVAPEAPIVAPRDAPFPGVIQLSAELADPDHRVVGVREMIPVGSPGDLVLLYPKWLPGTHAPQGVIDRLAGLTVRAGDRALPWRRDTGEVFAFHVEVPPGVNAVDVAFQYLSPVDGTQGETEITPTMADLDWTELTLYPAGWYVRQVPVVASLVLPEGWSLASALETEAMTKTSARFRQTTLETLMDSPVYAGRFVARFDLDPGGPVPARLNVFADEPGELAAPPAALAAHRALVGEARALFGARHYDHYDFLLSISDLTDQRGLEHHRSSENGVGTGYFTHYAEDAGERDLLPHEYTHSWNGKFRRPADLWTPDYETPMRDTLLWVYEGQTQYWGGVLAARSGLRTAEQARETLALSAATLADRVGRRWRPLQDTTNDEIINPRRKNSWPSWQRQEDYYEEGALVWLDVDTLIREQSAGARSLDDFARAFFGMNDGAVVPVTYRFEDVVAGLNRIAPYDWARLLRARLDTVGGGAPLDGLARAGWTLIYDDKPNAMLTSYEGGWRDDDDAKYRDFSFSLGFSVGKDGALKDVVWDGPAWRAGLIPGDKLIAIDGWPYSDDRLERAIKAAETAAAPLEIIIRSAQKYRVARIDYHGGLRYPHLAREPSVPDRLDQILAPHAARPAAAP